MTSRLPLHLLILLTGLVCALPGCKPRKERAAAKATAAKKEIKAEVPVMKEVKAEKPAEKHAKKEEKGNEASWEVRGWGRNQEEAEENALKKARDRVEAYLRQRKPPIHWTPTLDFVHHRLKRGNAQRREELDQEIEAGNEKVKAQCWTVTVAVTAGNLSEIARLQAEERALQVRRELAMVARDRMLLLGKVLLGLVAGLGALLTYIRLDDLTKGYYSRILGAGVVAFLAMVGVGLWLCC
jgi:hypothetical protein